MNAKKLIDLAARKGYGIGCNKPGHYRYCYDDRGTFCEQEFRGTWHKFVRFMKDLPNRA